MTVCCFDLRLLLCLTSVKNLFRNCDPLKVTTFKNLPWFQKRVKLLNFDLLFEITIAEFRIDSKGKHVAVQLLSKISVSAAIIIENKNTIIQKSPRLSQSSSLSIVLKLYFQFGLMFIFSKLFVLRCRNRLDAWL